MDEHQLEIDRYTRNFLMTLSLIILVGVVMVFSASFIYAKEIHNNSAYYFFRQLIYITMGSMIAFGLSRTKFSFWIKYAYHINVVFIVFLILTIIPGIGAEVKGASRWIGVKGFTIQPGEFIKYSVLLTAVIFFEQFSTLEQKTRWKYLASIFVPLLILIKQPDFGAFAICFVIIAFVAFVSHFPRKYFYTAAGIGTVAILGVLFMQPYRVARILSYLDPWKNPKGAGFQIIQSYLAFANGSFFGQGIGNSNEKLFYLPEAHNDFIFSVIGEELGLFGVLLIVMMFLVLIYWGFRVALSLNNNRATMVVSSIVFLIGFQTFLNMGVVLGLLPTKGLNLPFISYGGSSILSNFVGIGLMLSAIRSVRQMLSIGKTEFEN